MIKEVKDDQSASCACFCALAKSESDLKALARNGYVHASASWIEKNLSKHEVVAQEYLMRNSNLS